MNYLNVLRVCFGIGVLGLLWGCGGGGADPNGPPRLISLDDVIVPANETSAPIPFTVLDDDDPARVSLSADSSNAELLPASGVTFGGSGRDRTVTLTPSAGVLGEASLTVTATDPAGLAASATFLVSVVAQEVSFSSFFRETFGAAATSEPRDVNSRRFDRDAGPGEFDDLLGQP